MKTYIAIISTTHIDRHNERMTKEALDSMCEQIKSRFLPILVDHDPKRQIGVGLTAKVVRLEDGEFALYSVGGIFDDQNEKFIHKIGEHNNTYKEFDHYLKDIIDKPIDRKKLYKPTYFVADSSLNIADLLERHLDSTQIWTDGRVIKIKHFIASAGDLRIEIYPGDHDNHFHIISKQRCINARFDIDTLELINEKYGKVKPSDVKKIQNFFKTNPNDYERLKREKERLTKKNRWNG